MMKYFGWIFSSLLMFSFVGAATLEDTQIFDALDKQQQEEMLSTAQALNEKVSFTQVNSCESMETVFGDFLELYKKYYPKQRYPMYLNDGLMFEDMAMKAPSAARDTVSERADAGDYSTTNLQKAGVDEPEILKSNGTYLFYYVNDPYNSTNTHSISIIKIPTSQDLKDAEVVKKIVLPQTLSDIQLFLQDEYLIILATRYASTDSFLDQARTVVIVYNIRDIQHLVLEKLAEVYGFFQDARIVDKQLYLVSNVSLRWYDIAYGDKPILFRDVQPMNTEISLKPAAVSSGAKTVASYEKVKSGLPCTSMFYLFPSEETLKETQLLPNFTLISQLPLDNLSKKMEQKMVFGSVEEFHMSDKSLYLPSPVYFSTARTCRGCRWPMYSAGQHTLIHKFSIGNKIAYQDSLIVPGLPLSQYSMDEDVQGNFRILTKTWSPNLATQFFVFDKNFTLTGSLLNIEPGEEFKSSRYIGDKLYLVTFQQIDPLFVVDIADISKPKIVGELKILGYSTYLHPYADRQGTVQYLIGLGYSTQENQRGGVTNDSVKVDLYKIDYAAKETIQTKCSALITKDVTPNATNLCGKSDTSCTRDQMYYENCVASVNTENIAVELVTSYTFSGGYSSSPSLQNPRMFVRNSSKHQLLIPVVIQKEQYAYDGDNVLFLGLKALQIDSATTTITEIQSLDYSAFLKAQKNYAYSYLFANARVGYLGAINYFLLNSFAGFSNGTSSVTLGSL